VAAVDEEGEVFESGLAVVVEEQPLIRKGKERDTRTETTAHKLFDIVSLLGLLYIESPTNSCAILLQ
jgi:hypothetical protein